MSDSITPNKFYVYALYRPGCDDPFYIGKGCGSRIDGHENCAAKKNTCKHLTCRIIRKVWREGHEIRKEKIADGIPEHAAFQLEALFISIGAISQWPLVNLTYGGEGVSGYKWTPEQREMRRKVAAQQMDEAFREKARRANTGRKHSDAERALRSRALTVIWADPDMRKKKSATTSQLWQTQEMREKQQAGMMKPEVRAKLGKQSLGHTPPNTKTYPGFISPDGILYENVFNLTQFAKDHGLHPPDLCRVASGQARHTKGWTRYPPLDPEPPKQTYSGPGFVSPDGMIYQDIQNLTEFCKEHDLMPSAMCMVAQGKRRIHKGWTKHDL